MSRRAVVLAGGQGTRLRPYTAVLPKPLMPIGNYPILEIIVRQLSRRQFSHITLAVNHQADIIKAFFEDGRKWGVHIDYSLETEPLSTVAPLRLISDLPENFLLMMGDVLTDLDFACFHDSHAAAGRKLSVAATTRWHTIDYGVLRVDDSSMLAGFCEKPRTCYTVAMGVNMLNRSLLERIPPRQKYGMDDLLLSLLRDCEPVHIETHPGYWLDIGRPDDYVQAIEQFEKKQDLFFK